MGLVRWLDKVRRWGVGGEGEGLEEAQDENISAVVWSLLIPT